MSCQSLNCHNIKYQFYWFLVNYYWNSVRWSRFQLLAGVVVAMWWGVKPILVWAFDQMKTDFRGKKSATDSCVQRKQYSWSDRNTTCGQSSPHFVIFMSKNKDNMVTINIQCHAYLSKPSFFVWLSHNNLKQNPTGLT